MLIQNDQLKLFCRTNKGPTLVTNWIFYLSHFFPSLKFSIFSFFIITHDAFDIADPSSMQNACHPNLVNMTSLATSLQVVQWLERPTGVRKVVFDSRRGLRFFSLSNARDKRNISSFLHLFDYFVRP